MSHQSQTIRQQFLAVACQYLFGRNCSTLGAGGFPQLRLQPIPVRPQPRSR
jgi:hypothetical protein